jgi:hypothetical protein
MRKAKLLSIAGLIGGLLLGMTVLAYAGGPALPSNSNAFGKTFDQWQHLYWPWAYGAPDVNLPVDGNGNAYQGNVVLMPIPWGEAYVTMNAGQAFVLPLWNWLGEVYLDPSVPADPPVPLSVFRTLDIKFTIDDKTVVDTSNVMEYYTESLYDPPIPYIWPPEGNLVSLQGIGVVHTPLPPGQHIFKLDAVNTEPIIDGPGNEWIFEYHNSWHVTVKRGK